MASTFGNGYSPSIKGGSQASQASPSPDWGGKKGGGGKSAPSTEGYGGKSAPSTEGYGKSAGKSGQRGPLQGESWGKGGSYAGGGKNGPPQDESYSKGNNKGALPSATDGGGGSTSRGRGRGKGSPSGNKGANHGPSGKGAGSSAKGAEEGGEIGTRAKDEVFEEIRMVLEASQALQFQNFDARVRQYLHAIHGSGGRKKLNDAMKMILDATKSKTRQDVKNWPAYLLTLLKRFDSEQASQDREARARQRVAAAAAGSAATSAATSPDKSQQGLSPSPPGQSGLLLSAPPVRDPRLAPELDFDLDFDSAFGSSSMPWAAWGEAPPQTPLDKVRASATPLSPPAVTASEWTRPPMPAPPSRPVSGPTSPMPSSPPTAPPTRAHYGAPPYGLPPPPSAPPVLQALSLAAALVAR
ncbi:unnamed protein product [Polarella glacialis]|uniref:Uncharacterized protein n=1 Tax=Polarella glacialis TaxID=89957 RepID=A0A813E9E5_POLGL|nr:unnamed protein product [Polarella glacialis]